MSGEPGAEIPKPAWLQREQQRLAPKQTEHGVKTGPVQRAPSYQERVQERAARQLARSSAPTQPLSPEHVALSQTAELAKQRQEKLKRTRSLQDIVEGR